LKSKERIDDFVIVILGWLSVRAHYSLMHGVEPLSELFSCEFALHPRKIELRSTLLSALAWGQVYDRWSGFEVQPLASHFGDFIFHAVVVGDDHVGRMTRDVHPNILNLIARLAIRLVKLDDYRVAQLARVFGSVGNLLGEFF